MITTGKNHVRGIHGAPMAEFLRRPALTGMGVRSTKICATLFGTAAAAALDIGVVRTIIGLYVTVHFLTQSRQR